MNKNIRKASKLLIEGNVVIFPTETVYGIGADATNEKAIKKIYKIKNRPKNNPLICHFKDIASIKENFFFSEVEYKLAKKFWPGPLTLILKKKKSSKIKSILSNNEDYVGCRIPKNSIAKELLNNIDFPIAAPSANIYTKLSSTKIEHLSNEFKNQIFILDGGETSYGLESTVVKISNDTFQILRLGSITFKEIKKIIPYHEIQDINSYNLSPGQQKVHYKTNTPLRINVNSVSDGESLLKFGKNKLTSKILEMNLSPSGNLKEAAKNFYNFLHILDNSQCTGIAVSPIPNKDLGKTINDRLIRASSTI